MKAFLTVSFFVFFSRLALCQQITIDSLAVDSSEEYEIDTVVIYQEPFLINKTVYVPVETAPHSFSVDFYINQFYFRNQYSASNPDRADEAIGFKNNTSPALSYGFGGNVNYHKKKFVTSLGLGFASFREEYSSSAFHLKVDSSMFIDTLDSYYAIRGTDTTWFYTTENKTIIDSSTYIVNGKSIVSFEYLNLMVQEGYEWKYNKITCFVRAGVMLGLYLKAKEKLLSGEDAASNHRSGLVSSCNLGYSISIGLNYVLSQKTAVFAEPYFTGSLNSVFKKEANTSLNRMCYGLRFGLRYFF